MSSKPTRALRVWPAVVILLLGAVGLPIISYVTARTMPDVPAARLLPFLMGGPLLGLLLLLWWMFASRTAWSTRLIGLGIIVVVPLALWFLVHPSMRLWILQFTLPWTGVVAAVWAVAARGLGAGLVQWGVAAIVLLSSGLSLAGRFDGMTGDMAMSISWRWSRTTEDDAADYFARQGSPRLGEVHESGLGAATEQDWPEFRGPRRDGVVRGVAIRKDWNERPPELLWRHPVGLGWSSFSVVGDLAVTQEQRHASEVVVGYDLNTGTERWVHSDEARFQESMGGDGPRATPTYHDGRIYAVGATGILNCLDAATGRLQWSANILTDSGAGNIQWGMSGSPLVIGDLVIVSPGGKDGGLLAYHWESGNRVWAGGKDPAAYSSPQHATLLDTEQVLIFDLLGLSSFDPASGKLLWKFPRRVGAHNAIQPHIIDESTLLVATSSTGASLLGVQREGDAWSVEERWRSRFLKVNYNDLVIHGQHAYGLDEGILTCIDLAEGKRQWKRGRYGYGQILLVDDVLLIQAESGFVALVQATPEQYEELARFPALSAKTWNHPVIASGRLLVRNGEEAACFDVSMPAVAEADSSDTDSSGTDDQP